MNKIAPTLDRQSIRLICFGGIIFIFCIGYGCTSHSDKPEGTIELDLSAKDAVLTDAQLKDSIARANQGDGRAAYRVWAHYVLGAAEGEKGISKAQPFFDRAVELEYPPALYTKAVRLWNLGEADPTEVMKIAARAIELGQPDTANLIPELRVAIAKKNKDGHQ